MTKRVFTSPNAEKMEYDRLMGFHVSREMDALITLASLNRRISRSALLRISTADWLKRNHLTMAKLIETTVSHCWVMWQHWKYDNLVEGEGKKEFVQFKKELKQDLGSRNLSDEIVEEILNKFDAYAKSTDGTKSK